jgi:mannose-1-phosphate guanylyltransferase/mannose-6-phosphate isomerase
MRSHRYALVLAGGSGSRLWPLRHKPLMTLNSEKSLFEQTIERLRGVVAREHVYVVTDDTLYPRLCELAPDLHYIVEPSPRDTAAAVGLGLLEIIRHDDAALMAVLSSDHYIEDDDKLRHALRSGFRWAKLGTIALLGAMPTFAATGYGYHIHGPALAQNVYQVGHFIEKPPAHTAQSLIDAGNCSWDAGMFVVSAQVLLEEYERQQPQLLSCLQDLSNWQTITPISLDYAIMEGARNRVVIRMNTGWSDVGSWGALYDALPKHTNENAPSPDVVTIEARRNLVRSSKPTAIIGLDDIIVVDTADGLLVCHRDYAQMVRQVSKLITLRGAAAVSQA